MNIAFLARKTHCLFLFSVLLMIVFRADFIVGKHSHLTHHSKIDSSLTQDDLEENQVPTLENLFQKPTYWDINNISSPCKYSDFKRNYLCQKIVTFDKEGYEKSLQDTKKLFLDRLELTEEPDIKMDINQLRFLEEIEHDLYLESKINDEDQGSVIKTKYDMKSSRNVISNSMHEALVVNNCQNIVERSDSLLCLTFEVPMKNLLDKGPDNQHYFHKIESVTLWVHIENKVNNNNKIKMEILNLDYSQRAIVFNENELENGWNTLDIKDVFHLPKLSSQTQNQTLKVTFLLKCLFECKIRITGEDNHAYFFQNQNLIAVSSSSTKRPLLSVNLNEQLEIPSLNSNHRSDKRSQSLRNVRQLSESKKSYLSASNLCQGYPNSVRECCLITYYVEFNALKWTWIVSPSGFLANYCNGKCNQKSSFHYASGRSHNPEIKLQYNDQLRLKETYQIGELMETCCHPTSMDSLVINYYASNGTMITKVLPNMIITGCGCS